LDYTESFALGQILKANLLILMVNSIFRSGAPETVIE